MRALSFGKKASQSGERQHRFPRCQTAEYDANRFPDVMTVILKPTLTGDVAQPVHGVPQPVTLFGQFIFRRPVLNVENAALFHTEKKEEPIHEPQQFMRVIFG